LIFQYHKKMTRTIANIEKRRGRGRPATNATCIMVRVLPNLVDKFDRWRDRQDNPPGRPEGIRLLMEFALRELGSGKSVLGKNMGLRLHSELNERLEKWRARQAGNLSRQQAVRHLVECGLKADGA
jgi:hypothetical protein